VFRTIIELGSVGENTIWFDAGKRPFADARDAQHTTETTTVAPRKARSTRLA
jgi:hypothetical protein